MSLRLEILVEQLSFLLRSRHEMWNICNDTLYTHEYDKTGHALLNATNSE